MADQGTAERDEKQSDREDSAPDKSPRKTEKPRQPSRASIWTKHRPAQRSSVCAPEMLT